jgi:hypothetical protein
MNIKPVIVALGLAIMAFTGSAVAQNRDYGINVINETGTTIEYFYYSACRDQNWGRDRLGNNEVIQNRQSRFFDMSDGIRSCCRDIRAKLVNGASRQRMNVDVCVEHQWVVQ